MDAINEPSDLVSRPDAPLGADGKPLRFREAMAELNDIVAQLESNKLELEESLVKYERAISLLRFLRLSLSSAQQKVDTLMGQLEASPDDATVDSTLSKA